MSKVEKAVTWAINTANDNTHGYSQVHRWGNPDYDCSSFIISAYEAAGVPVKSKGATYTGNMYSVFKKCGFKDVTKSVNLATGAGLRRGDVLLNRKKHTEMFIGNGKNVGAHIDENGGITGAKGGDNTGREICISNYYNFPWTDVLRFEESGSNEGATAGKFDAYTIAREVMAGKWGNGDERKKKLTAAGYNYAEIQKTVNELYAVNKTVTKGVDTIAREVIAGKWGNGKERKQRLTAAGYSYKDIQRRVNYLLYK